MVLQGLPPLESAPGLAASTCPAAIIIAYTVNSRAGIVHDNHHVDSIPFSSLIVAVHASTARSARSPDSVHTWLGVACRTTSQLPSSRQQQQRKRLVCPPLSLCLFTRARRPPRIASSWYGRSNRKAACDTASPGAVCVANTYGSTAIAPALAPFSTTLGASTPSSLPLCAALPLLFSLPAASPAAPANPFSAVSAFDCACPARLRASPIVAAPDPCPHLVGRQHAAPLRGRLTLAPDREVLAPSAAAKCPPCDQFSSPTPQAPHPSHGCPRCTQLPHPPSPPNETPACSLQQPAAGCLLQQFIWMSGCFVSCRTQMPHPLVRARALRPPGHSGAPAAGAIAMML